MRRDYPLWMLVAGTVTSYPALALAWCVGMVIVGQPSSGAVAAAGHPTMLAAAVLTMVGAVSVASAITVLIRGSWQTSRFFARMRQRSVPVRGDLAVLSRQLDIPRLILVDIHEPIAVPRVCGVRPSW